MIFFALKTPSTSITIEPVVTDAKVKPVIYCVTEEGRGRGMLTPVSQSILRLEGDPGLCRLIRPTRTVI